MCSQFRLSDYFSDWNIFCHRFNKTVLPASIMQLGREIVGKATSLKLQQRGFLTNFAISMIATSLTS